MQAGVALLTLAQVLRTHGLFFPPTPTYDGAFVGGVTATNAAGARTFKYGTTRAFVRSLSVVLANGDVLDVEREQCQAADDGRLEIELVNGDVARLAIPTYAMPRVPKHSAGYHAEPRMDLVDLFLGSEGTLGVITEVELRVMPEPARCLGWLALKDEAAVLRFAAALREDAHRAWRGEAGGIDVASIESMDRRSLELLREDGSDREAGLVVDAEAAAALLFEIETRADSDAALERLHGRVESFADPSSLVVALPGDTRRTQTLFSLREGVPLALNRRVEDAQRRVDPRIHKLAADMIVPFGALGEALAGYRGAFAKRGLDHAIFGHLSDGNLHANAIPHSYADVEQGQAAILEMGDLVMRLGGSPMSEHGVGRNRVKQELLRRLYGEAGIAEMRRVKAALDPEWKLAPGVLFPASMG